MIETVQTTLTVSQLLTLVRAFAALQDYFDGNFATVDLLKNNKKFKEEFEAAGKAVFGDALHVN